MKIFECFVLLLSLLLGSTFCSQSALFVEYNLYDCYIICPSDMYEEVDQCFQNHGSPVFTEMFLPRSALYTTYSETVLGLDCAVNLGNDVTKLGLPCRANVDFICTKKPNSQPAWGMSKPYRGTMVYKGQEYIIDPKAVVARWDAYEKVNSNNFMVHSGNNLGLVTFEGFPNTELMFEKTKVWFNANEITGLSNEVLGYYTLPPTDQVEHIVKGDIEYTCNSVPTGFSKMFTNCGTEGYDVVYYEEKQTSTSEIVGSSSTSESSSSTTHDWSVEGTVSYESTVSASTEVGVDAGVTSASSSVSASSTFGASLTTSYGGSSTSGRSRSNTQDVQNSKEESTIETLEHNFTISPNSRLTLEEFQTTCVQEGTVKGCLDSNCDIYFNLEYKKEKTSTEMRTTTIHDSCVF